MTHMPAPVANADLPDWLVGELRSDHAGETGAVMIYRGILAFARDPEIREFAARHGATEQGHLDLLEGLLPPRQRSVLLPIWRVAGWLTGALPALAGNRAIYATIDAVETFVDHHYQAQIDRLDAERIFPEIRALLAHCQEEEVEHRDEAREAADAPPGLLLRGWAWLVGSGSAAAVQAARRI
ncbi:demethoxyubiquinone hydroxylase family protein [Falsiroseomonas tokyonensis]|uniref:Demethoxyubiquinone hydroxylase family protein n=1 Tax=Falsiroseomonas tokyonensis TaxID=430521 RepID=A0ABV7BRR4_9PROT|nr:demethoxyubiquinone hydroxylase family protein [Falsiroseomonas tokyonensis]MBU8536817.1 demethoxyubiquinone hydroxylase family protein [Falsiroseomonas tokyonensis]